jgi:hypothetical protein
MTTSVIPPLVVVAVPLTFGSDAALLSRMMSVLLLVVTVDSIFFGRHTGNWFDWSYDNIRDTTAVGSCCAFDVWIGRGIIIEDDVSVVAGGHC